MKKVLCIVMALYLIFLSLPNGIGNSSLASTTLPSSLYARAKGSDTCTLASAAMMLRARAYLSQYAKWADITETAIKPVAWSGGLLWNFTYSFSGNQITVAHNTVNGFSTASLKSLLDSHPEGIVLYCGNIPHAVFVTDYEGSTFYCADPYGGDYSGKRLALASSSLRNHYSTQNSILSNTTAYWYVSSYKISGAPVASVVSTTQNTAKIRADFTKVVVTNAGYNIYNKNDECIKAYDANYSGTWNTNYLAWTVWNLSIATAYKMDIWYDAGGKRYTTNKVSFRTASATYPEVAIYGIQENQVKICTDITKQVVTNAGYNIYKGGECVKAYDADYSGTWNTNYLAWTVWNLQPGTNYEAQIWFESGGKRYTSNRCAFTTAGSLDVTGIDVPESISMCVGEQANLEWELIPENAVSDGISFSSSNPGICQIDENGLISALDVGQATITITASDEVSAHVTVNVDHNIVGFSAVLNGAEALYDSREVETVSSGSDIPYEYHYVLSNNVDPGYQAEFSDSGRDDTVSWSDNEDNRTVRFGGYGLVAVGWETPVGWSTWGNVLVVDEGLGVHVPESVTEIEEEAFIGTSARFFYLPDGVRTIGANAFPNGSFVFLNTQNIEEIHLSSGDGIRYIETSGIYNEDFAGRTGRYYVPNGVPVPARWGEWSEWSTDEVYPSEDLNVETKTQYRSRDKVTTTSYSSWSKWSAYTKKRQTITDSNLKEERSTTVWPYYYYKCASCGQHSPVYGITCLNSSCSAKVPEDWHEFWLPVNPSSLTGDNAKWYTYSKKWTNDSTYGNGISFYNTNTSDYPSGTGYSYRTRKLVTTESWSDWSTWSDDATQSSDTREVETRTLYRYQVRQY